jgi:hypothetical protein
MYITDSMSSRLDLLLPRQELSDAKRKFPENFLTYYFSKWRPSSSMYDCASPKSIRYSLSVSLWPIRMFSSFKSLCTNLTECSSLSLSIYLINNRRESLTTWITILNTVARLKRRLGHCFYKLLRFGPSACNNISLFLSLSTIEINRGNPISLRMNLCTLKVLNFFEILEHSFLYHVRLLVTLRIL